MALIPPSETPIYDELATKYNAKALYEQVFVATDEDLPPIEPLGVNIGTN
jgi:hypothetical protein